ncbi:response regulator [Virgibacillus ainsalahensis]
MDEKFHVLIVEDDFRIADIHRQYVEKVEGYVVGEAVKTGEDALSYMKACTFQPDLILLDIYIPDVKGMELFWEIRETYHDMDIIVITAAQEVEVIEEALRGGVFDYIVKPVDALRFEEALNRYKQHRQFFATKEILEQEEIDLLTGLQHTLVSAGSSHTNLPKGIDSITLDEITDLLKSRRDEGITAVEVAKQSGISRSTARRYLEYLVSIKEIRTTLKYGTVGRPERQYIS